MNYGEGSGKIETSGELYIMKYIKSLYNGNQKLVVFDVGANVGHYSEYVSSVFGSNTDIYAFEPAKKTFNSLVENCKNNNNIKPINLGISDQEATIVLNYNPNLTGVSSIYVTKNQDLLQNENNLTEEIKVVTIDSFCATNQIERINFLKIDIEGHEVSALIGAKKMIDNGQIDHIQFEFGAWNIESKTYIADFFKLLYPKYSIYRIVKNGFVDLKEYNPSIELFTIANYFAKRRV